MDIETINRDEELREYIKDILKHSYKSIFLDKTIDEIISAIHKRPSFSYERFKSWIKEKNLGFKTYPENYLKKSAIEDIKSGAFDNESIRKGYPANNAKKLEGMLKINYFDINSLDLMIIHGIAEYAFEKCFVTESELDKLNLSIIQYLSKLAKKDTKSFIECLKRSNTLKKFDIPFAEIEEQSKEAFKAFNELIKQFGDD